MANNPNAFAGLTAISPTVSAYQSFVEQKDKVNGANIIPFLVSRGEPQLAGLIAKKLRLENATKTQQQMAQQPPAAPPTVAQQYDAMLAQQQAPRMPQAPMAPPAQMPPAQMPPAAAGGVAAMPNPAMERGFAGGGIVAFSEGGGSMSAATWEQLEEAFTKGGPAQQARVLQWAEKNMPTFARWARSGVPGTGMAKAAAKAGAPIAVGLGAYAASQSDPESIQNESRLAQMGMDVDPNSKFKTGLATFTGALEGALPTSLLYDTPLERARRRTEQVVLPRESKPGVELNLSGNEVELANQYREIVKKFGASSPEATVFETYYRRQMGITNEAAAAEPSVTGTEPSARTSTGAARTSTGAARTSTGAARTSTGAARTSTGGTAATAPRSVFDIGAAPNLKSLSDEQDEFYKTTGTGTHSKALADQNKFIDEETKRLGGDRKQANNNFWIMTGASLLGSRSPYFANALGDSIKENYGNLIKDLKDISKENRELGGMRIQLQRAQEQAVETGRRDVLTRFESLSTRYEAKQMKVLEMENNARDKALDRKVQLEVAGMYSSNRRDAADELWAMWQSTQEKGITPEEKARRQRMLISAREAVRENTRVSSPTAYSADQNREAKRDTALANLNKDPKYVFGTPEVRATMEARARGAADIIDSQTGGSGGSPYADTPTDEIKAQLGIP